MLIGYCSRYICWLCRTPDFTRENILKVDNMGNQIAAWLNKQLNVNVRKSGHIFVLTWLLCYEHIHQYYQYQVSLLKSSLPNLRPIKINVRTELQYAFKLGGQKSWSNYVWRNLSPTKVLIKFEYYSPRTLAKFEIISLPSTLA